MNTQNELILDVITFKEALDNALSSSYEGGSYMLILDIFGQEVTVYTRNSETCVMSDKKDVIWQANNHKGSQAQLVEWLMGTEDNKK